MLIKRPIALHLHLLSSLRSGTRLNMTWSNTWDDILSGGNPRWKVTDVNAKQIALDHILSNSKPVSDSKLNILCPLAGDDSFVQFAWSQGHSVTAIDLVPAAVGAMRNQFSDGDASCWTEEETEEGLVEWKHKSGRATLYQGDVLTLVKKLRSSFDAVYDKDSFGALPIEMRRPFADRIAAYLKPDGIIYTEVKNKADADKTKGPPYHVDESDLREAFDEGSFEYVKALGEVYKLSMTGMSQTGHIIRRLPAK